jgi:hypothetical protein
MSTTRPKSILWFELLSLGAILISLIAMYEFLEPMRIGAVSPLGMIGAAAISIALPLLLTLLVSRKRSNVAKWVYVVLMALGFIAIARVVLTVGTADLGYLGAAVTALQAASVVLLFAGSARAWLSGTDAPDSRAELEGTYD